MVSLHTSPTDPPGTGDAGGLNVYVRELSRRLADRGIEVDVYTRATSPLLPTVLELTPGVRVRSVVAGPYDGLSKSDLPGQLLPFAREVLRQPLLPDRRYDVVHSHYWLSGQVGAVLADHWGVPLVHAMHTMAKVKNDALAVGESREPYARVVGEEQVVDSSDLLVANTAGEARVLVERYGADPDRVAVVHPGVDLDVFGSQPDGSRSAARRRLGLPGSADVLLFVGRLQPLKGPDVLLRSAAALLAVRPELRGRLVVPIVGGASGNGTEYVEELDKLAADLGLADVVRFVPPTAHHELADWYAAATLVAVPSHSESFGLVALEAQAAGTPVVAANVGGLSVAVDNGRSGLLVDGHAPVEWARQIGRLLDDPHRLVAMSVAARTHAAGFGWDRTTAETMQVYHDAILSPGQLDDALALTS